MSPQYCNIKDAVILFFKNYVNFSARSTRSEFWWWELVNLIISGVLYAITAATEISIFQSLWGLAVLIPGLALSIRRMHDIGKSGWWILTSLIPIAGIFIYLYLCAKASDGPNEYGEPAGSEMF